MTDARRIIANYKSPEEEGKKLTKLVCGLFLGVFSLMFWAEKYPVVLRYSILQNVPDAIFFVSSIASMGITWFSMIRLRGRFIVNPEWGYGCFIFLILGFPIFLISIQLGLIINGAIDFHKEKKFQTIAVGKRIILVRGATNRYIKVRDWRDSDNNTIELKVGKREYKAANVGSRVYLVTKPGFLGYEWILSQPIMKS